MKRTPVTTLSPDKLLTAPSILSADFSMLGSEIKRIDEAGCDVVHLDIMDGHFVPNLTFGPPIVKAIRKYSSLCFDAHLMITNPIKYVEAFADAGADHITFHIESEGDPDKIISEIKKSGCSAGICVKPATPASAIIPFLKKIDLVLVMTVEPGFGGQSFMAAMMPKMKEIKDAARSVSNPVHIQVDGGIGPDTVKTAAENGANMMVAGTSVFKNPSGIKKALETLRATEKFIYS
jgi:ribulose-phosphate 3-epimerase